MQDGGTDNALNFWSKGQQFESCWLRNFTINIPHHAKMDLNKKSFPKKKNLQTFKVDAKGFRKNRNENVPT